MRPGTINVIADWPEGDADVCLYADGVPLHCMHKRLPDDGKFTSWSTDLTKEQAWDLADQLRAKANHVDDLEAKLAHEKDREETKDWSLESKIAYWFREIWSRFRYVIHIDGDVYLVRYRLWQWPRRLRRRGWPNLYLHHICRSDSDREYHDHPWAFKSLILWGGYWEHLPGGTPVSRADTGWEPAAGATWHGILAGPVRIWRGPGTIVRRQPGDLHRVELPAGRTAWTLVTSGRKSRPWGFQGEDGQWIDEKTFHKQKGYTTDGRITHVAGADRGTNGTAAVGTDEVAAPAGGGGDDAGDRHATAAGAGGADVAGRTDPVAASPPVH